MSVYILINKYSVSKLKENTQDRLNSVRRRRKIIADFRKKYPKLYNYNRNNEDIDLSWDELSYHYKKNLIKHGYTERIWNNGQWPIRIGLNHIYNNINLKYKIYKTLADKYNRLKYQWVCMCRLYEQGRATPKNNLLRKLMDLPIDIRNTILYKYLEI